MRRTQRSPEAVEYRRLYHTAAWQRRRLEQLSRQPLCEFCLARGRVTPATVADHVVRHRGNRTAFFEGDLQSLCDATPWRCHSSTKQRIEVGDERGVDISGRPLDPKHIWNRGGATPKA